MNDEQTGRGAVLAAVAAGLLVTVPVCLALLVLYVTVTR